MGMWVSFQKRGGTCKILRKAAKEAAGVGLVVDNQPPLTWPFSSSFAGSQRAEIDEGIQRRRFRF
ncbi:MAG: hypothetical protein SV375_23705 [Thermodesulfobacteriota bacterium]|nr:hypothetical protein [Thermodesulfobacteriota bacterium]